MTEEEKINMEEEEVLENEETQETPDSQENLENPEDSETAETAEPAEEKDPLEAAQQEIEQLKTQILYKTAEFDNYFRAGDHFIGFVPDREDNGFAGRGFVF